MVCLNSPQSGSVFSTAGGNNKKNKLNTNIRYDIIDSTIDEFKSKNKSNFIFNLIVHLEL
ncbi:hypothetical protein HPL003_00545 [Paenibacillus terrae HPL-003]|uniref:Uncharacterized protein n=1 Tax=Paenibacillus terrae (strain HPL-003) TaxID=985665 RepID=G7VTL0_PAETH|nr:hypothetical protein HPL003_00545 [Paenibacillus terrae HPL-003]